ncbi:hypothetical protein ACFLTX_01240 [Chloroflexota bacterium]
MSASDKYYIGIDPFAMKGSYTYSILDEDCKLIQMDESELSDLISLIPAGNQIYVAVNGPQKPNLGLVRRELKLQGLLPGQMRGGDIRLAEKQIRELGIPISTTPSRLEICSQWMHLSFRIFKELENLGFNSFPKKDSHRLMIETNADAFFYLQLNQKPLPKSTLEGILQRQLTLFDSGVGIINPMRFFEEITRHKLLQGLLPKEILYSPEQLDAISAAYSAFLVSRQPDCVKQVGSLEEGIIMIPKQDKNSLSITT